MCPCHLLASKTSFWDVGIRPLQPGTSLGNTTFRPGNLSDWKLVVQLEATAPGAWVGFVDGTSYLSAIACKFLFGVCGGYLVAIYLSQGDGSPTRADLFVFTDPFVWLRSVDARRLYRPGRLRLVWWVCEDKLLVPAAPLRTAGCTCRLVSMGTAAGRHEFGEPEPAQHVDDHAQLPTQPLQQSPVQCRAAFLGLCSCDTSVANAACRSL